MFAPDDTATQGQKDAISIRSMLGHLFGEPLHGGKALMLLTRRHTKQRGHSREATRKTLAMQLPDLRRRNDKDPLLTRTEATLKQRIEPLANARQQPTADLNLIGSRGSPYRNFRVVAHLYEDIALRPVIALRFAYNFARATVAAFAFLSVIPVGNLLLVLLLLLLLLLFLFLR